MVTAAILPHVERSELAESGFAMIVEQFLRQSLEDSDKKRQRARALRGRIAMTASDYEQSITLIFSGERISILDGALAPLDAAIAGPYRTLVDLMQGDDNPVRAHLGRRINVRSSVRKPFFPLHVHNLMKLEGEKSKGSVFAGVGEVALAGAALVTALALLMYAT